MTNEQKKATMKFQNKLLGIMCLLLVPSTLLFGLIGNNVPGWSYSISANYYTNAKIFMIGLLFCTAVLFFSYSGYDRTDKIITNISAVAALGILMFPCDWDGASVNQILFPFLGLGFSHFLHCVCAITLFLSFALMIGWRFTRHQGKLTIKKVKRNTVYYSCAIIILAFMIIQIITSIAGLQWFTMINEFFMLTAFGIAWLVKGEAIPYFND